MRFDNFRVRALDGYRETRTSYDGVGNRVAARDPLSHTTVYTYDGLNRLVAVEDADPGTGPPGLWGNVTQNGYDGVGNRDELVYPNDAPVTHTYDALNLLVQVEDWDGGVTAYGYDEAGRVITAALPNGVATAYTYDAANRLTQIEHRNDEGSLLARYAYQLDNAPELGRFLSPDTVIPDFENPQSLNLFAYASNNAVNYTDPSGHRTWGLYVSWGDETCDDVIKWCRDFPGDQNCRTLYPDTYVPIWNTRQPSPAEYAAYCSTVGCAKVDLGGPAKFLASIIFDPVDWVLTTVDADR